MRHLPDYHRTSLGTSAYMTYTSAALVTIYEGGSEMHTVMIFIKATTATKDSRP